MNTCLMKTGDPEKKFIDYKASSHQNLFVKVTAKKVKQLL